jgi:hypothetical protein
LHAGCPSSGFSGLTQHGSRAVSERDLPCRFRAARPPLPLLSESGFCRFGPPNRAASALISSALPYDLTTRATPRVKTRSWAASTHSTKRRAARLSAITCLPLYSIPAVCTLQPNATYALPSRLDGRTLPGLATKPRASRWPHEPPGVGSLSRACSRAPGHNLAPRRRCGQDK